MKSEARTLPSSVQLVRSDKVALVALDGIQDQCLVRFRDLEVGKAALVGEIHLGRHALHFQAGHLGVHLEVDGFSGLHSNDELVAGNVAEDALSDVLVLDSDLSLLLVERLAGLEDERHAFPSRRIDVKHYGGKGRAFGVLGNGIVVEVAWFVVLLASRVLTQQNVLWCDGLDVPKDFGLNNTVGIRLCSPAASKERVYLFVTDILCSE